MYDEFGGRTSGMYDEFARCRSSVSGDGTGNVRRPLNYSNAVQGLFDGVQGHSRAIQGFLFFFFFFPPFLFFIFSGQHYEITGPSVRMPSAGPYLKGHAPGMPMHKNWRAPWNTQVHTLQQNFKHIIVLECAIKVCKRKAVLLLSHMPCLTHHHLHRPL